MSKKIYVNYRKHNRIKKNDKSDSRFLSKYIEKSLSKYSGKSIKLIIPKDFYLHLYCYLASNGWIVFDCKIKELNVELKIIKEVENGKCYVCEQERVPVIFNVEEGGEVIRICENCHNIAFREFEKQNCKGTPNV